jgi:hypothetical protein
VDDAGRVDGCECGPDGRGEAEGCIGGIWYGYCSSDYCYGLCVDQGRCDCPCHSAPTLTSTGDAE